MKALLTFLALPLLLVATASADWVIESKIESPQINSNTTMKLKGDKLRMDIASGPAGAMSSIIDTKSGDSIQILHEQKMAMKTNAAQLKQALEAAKQQAGAKKDGPAPAVQATGQKEKVGDYDTEIYTWTDGTTSSRLWVAKDHPQAAGLKAIEKQMRSGFLGAAQTGPDTTALPGAVLKTETTMGGTKVTNTILSVKEQAVDAKEFDVPAGYQTMATPAGN